MVQQHPRLRDDLVITRREAPDGATFVVQDPHCARYFHLREPEIFIARQLDGSTSLAEVRGRAEKHFQAAVSDTTLNGFVERLARLNLLAGHNGVDRAAVRSRIRGDLLYLRWKAFDPDRLLDWLHAEFFWLFTPAFVCLSAAAIVAAGAVTVANYGAIGRRLWELQRLDILLLAWGVLFGVVVMHELAHGLTCKHFGGRVRELGFMLIFFQPAMYCNVSDAWLMPEKRKRLWVTFAGAYFELALWAVATLIWWVTDPNTVINLLALVVMLTSGIKTLFNLNPLIKLDGYYLLSDFFDIPNLNRRARAFCAATMKGWLGFRTADLEPILPRERRILLGYGLIAGTFSFGLLAWIVYQLGRFLTDKYQALGFAAITVVTWALFGQTLTRTLALPMAWIRSVEGAGRRRRAVKMVIGLALLTAVLFFCHIELRVSAPFVMLPARHAEVRTEIDGIIGEVLVDEDERVFAGQAIARLSGLADRAELEKVEADIAATEAKLKMLKAGPRHEEMELARREIETTRERLERSREQLASAQRVHSERLAKAQTTIEKAEAQAQAAQAELDYVRGLIEQSAGSAKELQDTKAIMAVRQKEYEEAKAELRVLAADDLVQYRREIALADKELQERESRLALLQAGTRVEIIESTEAELARLRAQEHYLSRQVGLLEIVSPIAGVVTTPKLKDKVGQSVSRGDLIASVHDLSTIRVEMSVPEKEIADVVVGQPARLKARAFPHLSFDGVIKSIAPVASPSPELIGSRMILVTAELDNSAGLLKPEMTGNGKISCGSRSVLEVLTRRVVRYIRVEFWSWW